MEVMIKEGNWVNPQIKDHFYDQFLKEPTKDNFRDFMKKSCGKVARFSRSIVIIICTSSDFFSR